MVELLRPVALKQDKMTITLATNSVYDYYDPVLGITISKPLRTLTIGEFGYPGTNIQVDLSKPAEEDLKLYSSTQSLVKSCVDNAEDIKDRLLQILLNPQHAKDNVGKEELLKMPFKRLKNLFMNDVLSTKIYKEFKEFNSTGKLKPFWELFDEFIDDRNKYTHGHLCIVRPNFGFVIEYIDGLDKAKYAYIDKDILVSYNVCYMAIREVITQYNIIHQERLLNRNKD